MNYITPNLLKHGLSTNSRSSIGHAMYNYITSYILACKLHLAFIHQPFTHDCTRFEGVLGLNKMFPDVKSLSNPEIVRIRTVDFGHTCLIPEEVLASKINSVKDITRKGTSNTLFLMGDHSQFPGNLIKDAEEPLTYILSKAYWSVNKRQNKLYDNSYTNVAIHIRRGDITLQENVERWKDNKHYIDIIDKIRRKISNAKFFIFSEGSEEDFRDFKDVTLILNGDDVEAFHCLATADVLVTGQSTFSTILSYINTNKIIYTPCLSFTMFDNYSSRFIHFNNIENEL